MRNLIFLVVAFFVLITGCKKDINRLAGTWNLMRVEDSLSHTSSGGNGIQVTFDDGVVIIDEMAKDPVTLRCTLTNDQIKIDGSKCSVRYECNEDKLIIYSDITSCGFGCIGADVHCNQTITSYLTKAK